MFGLRGGFFFECCSPTSVGEPEFLVEHRHVSSRAPANLFDSASGDLKLYYHRWQPEPPNRARTLVLMHHGEVDHGGWFNGLAVRLQALGCACYAPDAQGFGQSDGARGYFESFQDLVHDFVGFCRLKWNEALEAEGNRGGRGPGVVLMGKGFGALVVLRALVELQPFAQARGVPLALVLVSPGFQFGSFISEPSQQSCGLYSTRCQRSPAYNCAGTSAALAQAAAMVQAEGAGGSGPGQIQHSSRWFPKMLMSPPLDPEALTRDPQVAERMGRDVLCWRQGFRARVLDHLLQQQAAVVGTILSRPEVFRTVPVLMLHGSGDKLYSVQGTRHVHGMWCHVAQAGGLLPRLKIFDGGFHQLLHEPNKDEVMNDIALFVTSRVGR